MPQPAPQPSSDRFKLVAYLAGAVVVAAITGAVVAIPASTRFHATGPANTGHEAVACSACHKDAPGTVRQQLQAKVQYLIGRRAGDVTFGTMRVQNEQCVGCHARDQDMHPVYRFLEPRFSKARAEIGAEFLRVMPPRTQGRSRNDGANRLLELPPEPRSEIRSPRCSSQCPGRAAGLEELPWVS